MASSSTAQATRPIGSWEGLSSRLAGSATGEPSTSSEAATTTLGVKEIDALKNQVLGFFQSVDPAKQKFNDGNELLKAMMNSLKESKTKKQADVDPTEERVKWIAAQKAFLKDYDTHSQRYAGFAKEVKDKCARLLKAEDSKPILHQELTDRTKTRDSVEGKLKKEAKRLSAKGENKDPKTQLYGRIRDVAGVRILVYFPDDVSRVVQKINNCPELEILNGVISFSRNRHDHRGEDNSDRSSNTDVDSLDYTYGPWLEKTVDVDETIEITRRWKNAGYRGLHLHVKLMPPKREPQVVSGNAKTQSDSKLVAPENRKLDYGHTYSPPPLPPSAFPPSDQHSSESESESDSEFTAQDDEALYSGDLYSSSPPQQVDFATHSESRNDGLALAQMSSFKAKETGTNPTTSSGSLQNSPMMQQPPASTSPAPSSKSALTPSTAWQTNPLPQGTQSAKLKFSELSFPEDEVVEIQITTVVTHAWSQIEHDVIYKNPHRIAINDTMVRMLDGINGLAINSEIMLDELRRTLDHAQQVAERLDNEDFRPNGNPFSFWKSTSRFEETFREIYLEHEDHWNPDPLSISILSDIAHYGSWSKLPIHSTAALRQFIKNILKTQSKQPQVGNIAIQALRTLSDQVNQKTINSLSNPEESWYTTVLGNKLTLEEGLSTSLYKLLLATNAFTHMVALRGEAALKVVEKRFPDAGEKLRRINSIVVNVRIPMEPDPGQTMKDLLEFACRFLTYGWNPDYGLAIILSKLWMVTVGLGFLKTDREYLRSFREGGKFQCLVHSAEVFQKGDEYFYFIVEPTERIANSFKTSPYTHKRHLTRANLHNILYGMERSWRASVARPATNWPRWEENISGL